MHFITDRASNGVEERTFTLGAITGVLWTPADISDRMPLVLLGHGDRPRTAEDEAAVSAVQEARAAGVPVGRIVIAYNATLAAWAVPEWQATMDALQDAVGIGGVGPIGCCGLALGTAIGVPLVAVESRIAAAVFGVIGARRMPLW